MKKAIALFCLVFLAWAGAAQAAPKPTGAPENLAAWQDWVLYGHEEQYYCPDMNGVRRCAWPLRLSMDLDSSGGRFTATFDLLTEGSFTLPGGIGAWPLELTDANGAAVPVLGENVPRLWLPAGRHVVSGRYEWPQMPETLSVPSGFILDLTVDGKDRLFPAMETDSAGSARLWLRAAAEENPAAAQTSDSLSILVNRLVQDSQPMVILSRFRLTVTGQAREVVLEKALLPETRATFLESPLPVQLSGAGLRVKVKPGVYEIVLESRSLNRSESAGPVPEGALWDREFWAFQAQPQLRLAEVSGAGQIDPSQADVYADWRNLPIYALEAGQKLSFTELRRGDPEAPPDQLKLARECWLDYDGRGLSCRDRLSGTLNRQWHLNTTQPFSLAQATLDGQPQVITRQTDSKGQEAPGLQLRKGSLSLAADLRIDDFNGSLPASGWDHDLETEGQQLNLPPGYQVFHASGADVLRAYGHGAGSWTGAWSTLDFFIVLIISIAAWKLYGARWGVLALLALIFCYQEHMAPKMVFLHLLACAALLRLLPPAGKVRLLVRIWRFAAVLTLFIFASFFLINQARTVIYPQLENPALWYGDSTFSLFVPVYGQQRYTSAVAERAAGEPDAEEYYGDVEMADMMAAEAPMQAAPAAPLPKNMARGQSARSEIMRKAAPESSSVNRLTGLALAPDAKVQNSLARPDWNWRTVRLFYNGSVSADQTVRLFLISPGLGRFLGLIRIGLMSAFTLMMLASGRFAVKSRLEEGGDDKTPKKFNFFPGLGAAMLALALALFMLPNAATAAENTFPDKAMLDEFRARLLTEQEMPPASISQARLALREHTLLLELVVESAEPTVLPLPSMDQEVFRYSRALNADADDSDLPLTMDERGILFCQAPAGKTRIRLTGPLRLPAGRESFQINFIRPALPHKLVISDSPFWKAEGLEADGRLRGEALSVTSLRGAVAADPEDRATSQTLEPFFMVQRTLSLGLEWRVNTTVHRLTPSGAPVSLRLPLIPGEEPMGDEFRRDGEMMTVNFAPGAEVVAWSSRLETVPEISLKAAEGPFAESWALDVSPLWRVKYEGLTPIHTVANGYWQPTWRPWPGEALRLAIDRPQPVPGEYRVIDRAELNMEAAENMRRFTLNFQVRGSQAGPYTFSLPPAAELREFTVDGRAVPLAPSAAADKAEKGPRLTASLSAGAHDIAVTWVDDSPISAALETPAIDLGLDTANIRLSIGLAEDRWVLWTRGPLNGPAVQFWPLLAVLLLAAVLLGRFTRTPLSWRAWFLLGLGLIQLNIFGAMLVAGWLAALGWRANSEQSSAFGFNAVQIVLSLWTFLSLYLIYKGIEYGLLANPDMLIAGGGSYGQRLSWFLDRASGPWPSGWVFSVSLWFYKAVMLAWSLWLAVNLIRWLKWGWKAFSGGGLWKKFKKNGEE